MPVKDEIAPGFLRKARLIKAQDGVVNPANQPLIDNTLINLLYSPLTPDNASLWAQAALRLGMSEGEARHFLNYALGIEPFPQAQYNTLLQLADPYVNTSENPLVNPPGQVIDQPTLESILNDWGVQFEGQFGRPPTDAEINWFIETFLPGVANDEPNPNFNVDYSGWLDLYNTAFPPETPPEETPSPPPVYTPPPPPPVFEGSGVQRLQQRAEAMRNTYWANSTDPDPFAGFTLGDLRLYGISFDSDTGTYYRNNVPLSGDDLTHWVNYVNRTPPPFGSGTNFSLLPNTGGQGGQEGPPVTDPSEVPPPPPPVTDPSEPPPKPQLGGGGSLGFPGFNSPLNTNDPRFQLFNNLFGLNKKKPPVVRTDQSTPPSGTAGGPPPAGSNWGGGGSFNMKEGGTPKEATILHVGERKPSAKDEFAVDEFVLAGPGTIVAPRYKDEKATPEVAMKAFTEMIVHGKRLPRKKMKAAQDGYTDPEMFTGSDWFSNLLQLMASTQGIYATGIPANQLNLFNMLGYTVPSAYGLTDPEEFRNAWETGARVPTLAAQEAERRYQLDQNRLALEELLGTGRLDLDRELGVRRMALEELLGTGRLDLDRELGRGQLAIGQGQLANEQARIALERFLGEGNLALGRERLGLEGELGRGRLGLDTELGRGRLSLDTELGRGQLDVARRAQAMAEQNLRTQRELRGLSGVPGAGQVPSYQ